MSQSAPGRSHRTGISLVELFRLFPDDAAAEAWFVSLRWPNGIACHHCGSTNVQTGCQHKTMPFRCREKGCAKRFSVRTGSVMQSSKLGFQVWAIATYLMTTNLKGISSMKLHRELDVTQKTAWHLAHRLREGLTDTSGAPFTGPVEVDETHVGGKAKSMHARRKREIGIADNPLANKVTVAGVKDRETGKVRAAVVPDTEADTLRGFVTHCAAPSAMVYSDGAPAYGTLPLHESVNHGVGEYVRGQAGINGMESFWSMLKRGYVGVFHRMSPEHLHRYVGEFEGRHNNRDADTIDQMGAMVRGARESSSVTATSPPTATDAPRQPSDGSESHQSPRRGHPEGSAIAWPPVGRVIRRAVVRFRCRPPCKLPELVDVRAERR